jgi:hypothetical protein
MGGWMAIRCARQPIEFATGDCAEPAHVWFNHCPQ